MVTGISALPTFEEKTTTTAPAKKDQLGQDAFLKMFIAQMNNQDPLNPMDISQMSSQLAQYSSLEQLLNINTNLESIEGVQNSSNKYQSIDMIGKEVQADSSTLVLDNGRAAKGVFYLGEAADCTVHILDEQGSSIRDINLGALGEGSNEFEWDGFDNNKKLYKSGQFTYEVTAVNGNKNQVSVNKSIKGTVTGVNLNGEEPILYVNSTPLSMSQIININMVKDATSTGS
jgi:flagellar basal-body rod modification protein FlgD